MQTQPAQKPPSHTTRNIGIVVLVILIIIVILAAIGVSRMSYVPIPTVGVTVTAINEQIVYPSGATSGFLGPNSQSMPFTGLPMTLGGGQGFTETFTLSNSASIITSHTIVSISTNTPGFVVNSVSPTLPYTLSPGSSVSLTVTLTASNTNYDGVLTLVISVK